MVKAWNKGLTKFNNNSVKKISETMKRKKLNNFLTWQKKQVATGKIISTYPELIKNGDLAELIGVTLGDGHICVYPRTEELRIVSNANNPGFVKRYSTLIENVFGKKAYIVPSKTSKCIKVGLYQKHISKRMDISSGARGALTISVPEWILENKDYIVRYLRGLYEAEGSFCIHEKTYTHKLLFSNVNESMLDNVYNLMVMLGFHPHRSLYQIQLSKKDEVYKAKDLLEFRKY